MSGVQIICFASSYAIALALEISRLMFRSAVRGVLLVVFAAAGIDGPLHLPLLPRGPRQRRAAVEQPGLVPAGRLGAGGRLPVPALLPAPHALRPGAAAAGAGADRHGGPGWPIRSRSPASRPRKSGARSTARRSCWPPWRCCWGLRPGVTYLGQRWRLRRKHGPLPRPAAAQPGMAATRQQPRHPAGRVHAGHRHRLGRGPQLDPPCRTGRAAALERPGRAGHAGDVRLAAGRRGSATCTGRPGRAAKSPT